MSKIKSRKPYIVVFGSQNVGKSTLVGYLFTKEWSEDEFLLEEQKLKLKIGSQYDFRSRLALFVDTAKDEYFNTHTDGTSKHIHIKEVGNFTWIDTPGSSTQRKERYKGVFLGELGVFLIELDTIIKLIQDNQQSADYYTVLNVFSSLLVWQRLKPQSKYLIGLTKIDIMKYDRELILKATNYINENIANDNLMGIIPMSINVEKRTDVGVTSKSKFYNASLIEKISEIENLSQPRDDNRVFLVNDKRYPNVNGQGEIFRWKINSGEVNLGDNLKIVPVLYRNNISAISAEINSIHDINRKVINTASSGDVISILFKKYRDKNGRSVDKGDVFLTKTSIAIDMQSDYVFGNHIYLQIDQTDCNEFDKNYIAKIKENSPVWFAWFGRMICTSLVKKQIISDSNYIQILLRSFGDKHIFALPRINGCVNHEKCIIQIKKQEADYPVFFTYKAVVKDIYMYERKE